MTLVIDDNLLPNEVIFNDYEMDWNKFYEIS